MAFFSGVCVGDSAEDLITSEEFFHAWWWVKVGIKREIWPLSHSRLFPTKTIWVCPASLLFLKNGQRRDIWGLPRGGKMAGATDSKKIFCAEEPLFPTKNGKDKVGLSWVEETDRPSKPTLELIKKVPSSSFPITVRSDWGVRLYFLCVWGTTASEEEDNEIRRASPPFPFLEGSEKQPVHRNIFCSFVFCDWAFRFTLSCKVNRAYCFSHPFYGLFLAGRVSLLKSRLQLPTQKKCLNSQFGWLLHLGLSLQTTKEPGRRRGGGHKNPKLSLDRDTTGSEIDKITLLKCVPKIGKSKFGEWPLLSRLASLKKAFFAAHGLVNFPQSTLLSSVYRHVCWKRGD